MNSPTVSSTQQQDQVARNNSAQMRRHGADQKAQQGASAFADLLQQAAEPAEDQVEAADLLDSDAPTDAQAANPAMSDEWLALNQAYQATRPADTQAPDTASTASGADAGEATTGIQTPATTTAGTDGDPVPELDAEARAEASDAGPRRTPKGGPRAQSAAPSSGLGAPAATRQDLLGGGTSTSFAAAATASGTAASATAGAAAVMASRSDLPGRAPTGAAPAAEATAEAPPPTPATASVERTGARGGEGAPQTDVQAGSDGPTTERANAADAPSPDTPAWDQQWGEAMEDLGHQVSYWLGRGVKQAHLQVGNGLERPLEVAVTLDKGQAMLHFQTDSLAARAAIESGAADALRQALARDGIGLAGLSVGSQDRQGQPGADAPPARAAWRTGGTDAGVPVELGPTTTVSRPAGNRVLDLYA